MNALTLILSLVIVLVGAGLLVLLGVRVGANIYHQGSLQLYPGSKLPKGDTRVKPGQEDDESDSGTNVFEPYKEDE